MNNSKIEVKDLINIGLFTAIYFIFIAPPGILGIIPIFMLLLPAMVGLIGGIPIILLRYQKFKIWCIDDMRYDCKSYFSYNGASMDCVDI